MSGNPLVSIIIPVYNGADFLSEAITSALGQSYAETEVLVIDDGSTDGGATRAVAESFGDRIRYLNKPNGGVATALNTGIRNMRGELFSWLSHDDIYRPQKVERQVDTWRSFGQRCIVIGDYDLMDAEGSLIRRVSIAGHNLIARPLDAIFRVLINGCALLVPRDLFDEVGLFEPGLPTTQDYDLWYRMARRVPFVHCPAADVSQRVHPLQGSRRTSHLDEASRMFAHLIDLTPRGLMEAYDGSELRFLLKTRAVLHGYPGLHSYLTFRVGTLLKQVRYSVVVWGADPANGNASAQLDTFAYPPESVVNLATQAGTGSDSGSVLASGTPADIVNAANNLTKDDIVWFAHASRLPSEDQVRAALETFIAADADAARAENAPVMAAELDGLVARHDVLPALEEALRAGRFGSDELRSRMEVIDYPALDEFAVETPHQITDAILGRARVFYDDRLSEAAIANLITASHRPELPTILFLQHSVGGGAQVHMNQLIQALAGIADCVVAYGGADGTFCVSLNSGTYDAGLIFRCPQQVGALARILLRSGVRRVDVHHTINFENHAEQLLEELQLPFDITLVDYHFIAHSPFLSLDDGRFVGDDRLNSGQAMLRREPLSILHEASRVIAVSRDLAERFSRLCPAVPVIPAQLWHDTAVRVRHILAPRIWEHEPLRIVIVGAIGQHKGRDLVIETAREIALRNLPLRLHILGRMHVERDTMAEVGPALTIHGPYPDGGFGTMLGGIAPHVGWIPAQVPETWSYVLSELMEAGLPVAASALGAIPERCHGRPYTWLLPWNSPATDWVDLFLRLHATRMQEPPCWTDISHLPPPQLFYFAEYLAPASLRAGAFDSLRNVRIA